MAIVRREGDWRLEKREEGVYEVTCGRQVKAKIITSEYNSDGLMDERADFTASVREVESFSDAEAVFNNMANGQPGPVGGATSQPTSNEAVSNTEDLPDLPPGGILLICLGVGGYLLVQVGFTVQSTLGLIGLAFLGGAVLVAGVACYVYATEGAKAAFMWLITVQESNEKSSSNAKGDEATPETTHRAPQQLKDRLHIDRADQQCEWCETPVNSPDVHHIEPRSEGGPNTPENLIVLCPNCHRKADRGAISQSKLRHKVQSQMANWNR